MNKKESLFNKYQSAANLKWGSSKEDFLAIFPTYESLQKFREEVGCLSYPESYGTSPWEHAFSVACLAANNYKVTNPFCFESGQKDNNRAIELRQHWGMTIERNKEGIYK